VLSGKLKVAAVTAGLVVGGIGLEALPTATASAEPCVLTVTLLGGAQLSIGVNVPPGTPPSSISLPGGLGRVANISESCASSAPSPAPAPPQSSQGTAAPAAPGPTTPGTTTTGPATPGTTTGTTTPGSTPQSPPHPRGPGTLQRPSTHVPRTKKGPGHKQPPGNGTAPSKPTGPPGTTTPPPAPAQPGAMRSAGGVPTPTNPTFSFALPGPSPIGVPNFFIDSFRIPPFLLPIYQAAGIEYDVPWQVLAAINEIETDYGRNLSVSSAGAVGWMQFLPATFKQYAVDATGTGTADPYNPVDAIFTAARYLAAAGASKNLPKAIFAYNHASWYVQSVLLRAKLIGGIPNQLIGALTGLVEGHFPVAAKAMYADDSVERLATRRVKSANAAVPIDSNPASKGVSIFANQGSPVVAVTDGKILKVGHSDKLGNFIELQDSTGNIYTYANLGSIPSKYPVPKPVKVTAAQIASELSAPTKPSPKPQAPASAGAQQTPATVSAAKATRQTKTKPTTLPVTSAPAQSAQPAPAGIVKERLFAYPARRASYAAGGDLQLHATSAPISSFQNYFSDVLHLGKNQYTLQPLKAGAVVVSGTILGRIGPASPARASAPASASHLLFTVRPAGKNAPPIDPKPILDGWKLLEATAVYRAAGVDPFYGPGGKNPTVGQVLLESKAQLTNSILIDPHVQVYACGRRDIQAGLIDRRILATIEFLSASGLDPSISGLACGPNAAGANGSSADISKVNNVPVLGHQGSGSITDLTVRRLLTLQGALKPDQIISTMSYKGQTNTLALPDHKDRVQVTFVPLYGQNKKLAGEIQQILKPGQWVDLINRIGQIPEPVVPIAPSQYAVKVPGR